jgi:hypothetical protein
LKGLKMILWQKFLLKYKQETICKKRENDEQVSYNLKSLKIKIKVTALAPSLDWSLKTILDKPTTMTPISARQLIFHDFRFEENDWENESGDNGATSHHLINRAWDEVECNVL